MVWLTLFLEQTGIHDRPENPKRLRKVGGGSRCNPLCGHHLWRTLRPSHVSSALVYLNHICLLFLPNPPGSFCSPKGQVKLRASCCLLELPPSSGMSPVTPRAQGSQIQLPVLRSQPRGGGYSTAGNPWHMPPLPSTTCLTGNYLPYHLPPALLKHK